MCKLCTRFHPDAGGKQPAVAAVARVSICAATVREYSWQTTITKESPECIEMFAARFDVGGGGQQNNVLGFDCFLVYCSAKLNRMASWSFDRN